MTNVSFFKCIWATILLETILIQSYGQVTLGTGIVKIELDDKTVIHFYSTPNDQVPFKRIEFFHDKEINSWNIKNLETERNWLKPELLWLDYSQLNFRCKTNARDWLEVIVNNDDGKSFWIKRHNTTKFMTWEDYLKGMFAVDRRSDQKQKIRKLPLDTAEEIYYEGRDCFQVKSLKGDWIEIITTDYCDDEGIRIEVKSGWIKWRDGDVLLINYYTTS